MHGTFVCFALHVTGVLLRRRRLTSARGGGDGNAGDAEACVVGVGLGGAAGAEADGGGEVGAFAGAGAGGGAGAGAGEHATSNRTRAAWGRRTVIVMSPDRTMSRAGVSVSVSAWLIGPGLARNRGEG